MDGGDASGQPVLDLPESTPSQIHIVFHQSHTAVTRPTFFIVVAYDILVVWVGVLCQIALDELTGLV